MSSLAKKTPITTVASSGAEEPAAMKVAPATSGDSRSSGRDRIKKVENDLGAGIEDEIPLGAYSARFLTFAYPVQTGNEVVIADDGKTEEGVDSYQYVDNQSAVGTSGWSN